MGACIGAGKFCDCRQMSRSGSSQTNHKVSRDIMIVVECCAKCTLSRLCSPLLRLIVGAVTPTSFFLLPQGRSAFWPYILVSAQRRSHLHRKWPRPLVHPIFTMENREPQSLTAPLTLPNSVGQSLLTDDDIVSFLSRQNSQSSIIEDLEPTEVSQGVSAPVESSSTNESPHTPEDDSVQADAVKRVDNGHAQAGTNRTAWAMDVAAIFVAAACLISIYTVLGSLDNKEQPQWPLPATLNLGALIALLATILRSMIMGVLESGKQSAMFLGV